MALVERFGFQPQKLEKASDTAALAGYDQTEDTTGSSLGGWERKLRNAESSVAAAANLGNLEKSQFVESLKAPDPAKVNARGVPANPQPVIGDALVDR